MKRNLITLALICASFFCTTVCTAEKPVKETRETDSFRKISLGGGIDIYFVQSDSYSVVVEAEEKYLDKIVTEVKDETLVVKWNVEGKERIKIVKWRTSNLKVYVSAPALYEVKVSGGSDFYADKLKCDDGFHLQTSGGADAKIGELNVDGGVDISSSGGSDIIIESLTVAGAIEISTSGGSDCDVNNLQVSDSNFSCNFSSSGGGDLNIKNLITSGNLAASASGGADINISGKAGDVKISASGGADVNITKLTYTTIDITKSGAGDVHR